MTTDNKEAIDILAGGVGIMSWANVLPNIAAIFTIIWLGIRIIESDTSKQTYKFLKRRYEKWTSKP